MAAASVTRTASSAKARSSNLLISSCFHRNHIGIAEHLVGGGNGLQGTRHMRFRRFVSNHHNRNRLARRATALDHALDGDMGICKLARDLRQNAWLIQHLEPKIKRRPPRFRRSGGFTSFNAAAGIPNAEPAEPRAISTRSAITAEAVGSRPAPRPSKKNGPAKSAIGDNRVERAFHIGERRSQFHHRGLHALIEALRRSPRDPEQLDAIAELAREADIFKRDMRECPARSCAQDRASRRTQGSKAPPACAPYRRRRHRVRDRPPRNPSRCASASTSAKSFPVASICVRM